MALTDAIAVLFQKMDHLLRDSRVVAYDTLYYGPFLTAGGTGNKAEWIMPAAGEIVEVLWGAESAGAAASFNVENEGNDIWAADKATMGAGVFNAQPGQYKTFIRGGKIRVDISAAGTTVVNGAVAIVVVFYHDNQR